MMSVILTQDILHHMIIWLPDPALVNLLFVSRKIHCVALEECKRRSPLPHLWELNKQELLAALFGSRDGLMCVIHTDYALCATLGVTSARGVLYQMSPDIYQLARRMGVVGRPEYEDIAIALKAAQIGNYCIFQGEITTQRLHHVASDIRNVMKWSPSKQISALVGVYKHTYSKLYDMIHMRDLNGIRALPTRKTKINATVVTLLLEWLRHMGDVELMDVMCSQFPELKKAKSNKGVSGCADFFSQTFCWSAKANLPFHRIHYRCITLCVDNPDIVKYNDREMLAAIAKKSCCYKVLAACGVAPPEVENWTYDIPAIAENDHVSIRMLIAFLYTINPIKLYNWMSREEMTFCLSSKQIAKIIPVDLRRRAIQAMINRCLVELDQLEG